MTSLVKLTGAARTDVTREKMAKKDFENSFEEVRLVYQVIFAFFTNVCITWACKVVNAVHITTSTGS